MSSKRSRKGQGGQPSAQDTVLQHGATGMAGFGNAFLQSILHARRSDEETERVAEQGTRGSGAPLPHADRIQESFGHHDISGARAHVGGTAARASEELGARAYARGEDVAFGSSPDLFTAAHEAAHVVQQQRGVQLRGATGEPGDPYERQADEAARATVEGRSAEPILDRDPGGGGEGEAVQLAIEEDLREAMEGWGTDEDAIMNRLRRATAEELARVVANGSLMAELRDELSDEEMKQVLDLLRAPLAMKLRLAMEGWGTDEAYIHRSLLDASPEELVAVAADAALVARLHDELSGEDLYSVLDRLPVPLDQKLRMAVEGWGTDEDLIYRSVERAPAHEVLQVALDGALLALVDDDLSGEELDRWRGLLARRLHHELGLPIQAWRMCLDESADTRQRRIAWVGALEVQRAVLDAVILTSTDPALVIPAFQDYWSVETAAVNGASSWPVDTIRAIHTQLKVIPDQDTRSGVWRRLELSADPDLINRAAWNGDRGALIVGENISPSTSGNMTYGRSTRLKEAASSGSRSIKVSEGTRFTTGDRIKVEPGASTEDIVEVASSTREEIALAAPLTKNHAAGVTVLPDDATAAQDVPYIDATVLHEIGHAVDTALGGVRGFTVGLGGWWTGTDFDAWASAMGNPWATNDGSVITDGEQGEIKEAITDGVTSGKLWNEVVHPLPDDHALRIYLDRGVPVIEAARTTMEKGDGFYRLGPDLYTANGRTFSTSKWYGRFQYHSASIVQQRVTDYQLYAPAEFFADAYTAFYLDAGKPGVTEADYGRRLPNAAWRDWIRRNVHERNQAPTGTGSGDNPGTARPGGASFGRSGGNPGP